MVAVGPTTWRTSALRDYAAVAAKHQSTARLALLALPEKAYELAKLLDGDGVPSLDGERLSTVRIVPVPPWSEDAVHFHLDENLQVAESTEACASLVDATCGFGAELVRTCTSNLTLARAKNACSAAQSRLAPDLPTFYTRIGMPRSLSEETLRSIEQFLAFLDDGTDKRSPNVDEALQAAGLEPKLVHFLYWMGLLQDGPANTWRVPKHVRRLVGG